MGISTNKFVQISAATAMNQDTGYNVNFYSARTFTSQDYTFTGSDRYVVRAGAELPFGSFPGVGNIKT